VREGVFEGFLYDTYYGSLLKKASTGNAVRSGVKEPPKCGPRGFSIAPGAWDEAGGIERGIVVEELMGTHTANPVTGDFSVGAIGHLHEGGATTPFKGVILSGNLFDLLSQVRAVGKNVFFYGPYGAPALLVEGLKISGK